MPGLAKQYEILRKRHKLPAYKELDSVFEISSIDKGTFLLREIRRKMTDKLSHYAEILNGLINPDTTVGALYECKYFNEDEKTKIFELFRRIMGYLREADILGLGEDDAEEAAFIITLHKEWGGLQKDLKEVLTKLKKCWVEKEVSKKDLIEYFG